MPAIFDKLGIRFAYPDNWTLEEEPHNDLPSISVFSPSGAFWSLTIHPPRADPKELVQAVLNVFRGEYQELDVKPIRGTVFQRTTVGYDINFYCLDLINRASVRCFSAAEAVHLLLWQAEDEEFERLEAVFLAVTTSFILGKTADCEE